MLQEFLKYRSRGFSVIPVKKDKTPYLNWREFQNRLASEEEIKQWLTNWPDAQLAVATGEISNLVVLDIDEHKGGDSTPFNFETTTVRSGSGGVHLWFKCLPGLKNSTGEIAPFVDVRATGGYILVPPSKNENGQYTFIKEVEELLPFPEYLIKILEEKVASKNCLNTTPVNIKNFAGVESGSRNDSMARIIGSLLRKTHPSNWEDQAWSKVCEANQKNKPPLSEQELRKTFDSIVKAEESKDYRNQGKTNKAEKIVNFLLESGVKPFIDQHGKIWIAVNGNGSVVMRAESKEFSNYLSKTMFENGMMSGKDTVAMVVAILSGKAYSEQEEHFLTVRTAKDKEGNYWYDLGKGRAVKFAEGGWKIFKNPPIIFSAYGHQEPQPDPVAGNSLDDLMEMINTADEYNKILLKIYIVAGFIGDFAHPVLCVNGQHGSAKSTLFKLLKALIDPSQLKLLPPTRDHDQFIQIVSHNWVCFFDNLSSIKQDFSDSICRACTGGGFSKRELYTDDGQFILDIQAIIGLNGINSVVVNSDLFDRSILVELSRIPEEKRKTDQEINDRFQKIRPGLLEACLNAAAKAIAIKPSIITKKKNRMADFSDWGCAIAEALGIGQEKFLQAYERNTNLQNEESIENSPVALAIIELIKERGDGVNETPSKLLDLVTPYSLNRNSCVDKYWPVNSRAFGKKLREITPSLEKAGLIVFFIHGQERHIKIQPTDEFWTRYTALKWSDEELMLEMEKAHERQLLELENGPEENVVNDVNDVKLF